MAVSLTGCAIRSSGIRRKKSPTAAAVAPQEWTAVGEAGGSSTVLHDFVYASVGGCVRVFGCVGVAD